VQKARLRLTDLAIRSIAFSSQTKYVWDANLRGFGIRIGKHSKTFVAVRDGGRRLTLGKYPSIVHRHEQLTPHRHEQDHRLKA
jgi:hypothetical protein